MEEQRDPSTSVGMTGTKKFPVLMVILVVVLILSLGASGILAYQNMQLQKQITEMKKISVSSTFDVPNPLGATVLKGGKGVLTWDQVLNAIQICKLDAVYEHTNKQVEVHSDGYVYITEEPNYGDILNETKNAEPKCGKVYSTSGLQFTID